MNRRIEFIVKGIVEGVSGRLRVMGRCSEDSIRRGDSFQVLYRYQDGLDEAKTPVRSASKALALQVVGIQAYGREIEELGAGMTGTIDLVGTGRELVEPGCLLGLPEHAMAEIASSPQNTSHPRTQTT